MSCFTKESRHLVMQGNDMTQQSRGCKTRMPVKSLAFVAMLAILIVFGGGPLSEACFRR
jgi:hypothetical protein